MTGEFIQGSNLIRASIKFYRIFLSANTDERTHTRATERILVVDWKPRKGDAKRKSRREDDERDAGREKDRPNKRVSRHGRSRPRPDFFPAVLPSPDLHGFVACRGGTHTATKSTTHWRIPRETSRIFIPARCLRRFADEKTTRRPVHLYAPRHFDTFVFQWPSEFSDEIG